MVEAEDVGVRGGWAGHFVDGAVVVPFDVFDVGGVENFRDELDDVVLDFGEGEVENQLVSRERLGVLAGFHDPFGVLVVESRVWKKGGVSKRWVSVSARDLDWSRAG